MIAQVLRYVNYFSIKLFKKEEGEEGEGDKEGGRGGGRRVGKGGREGGRGRKKKGEVAFQA